MIVLIICSLGNSIIGYLSLKYLQFLMVGNPCFAQYYYSDPPYSTNFMSPGIRNIAKIVLFMDLFSTKILIYYFWIVTVPFFSNFYPVFNPKRCGGRGADSIHWSGERLPFLTGSYYGHKIS